MKTCTACKAEKALDQFQRDSSHPTGYASRCKACKNAAAKVKYTTSAETRDRINARRAERRDSGDYQRWLDASRDKRLVHKEAARRKRGAVPLGDYKAALAAKAEAKRAVQSASRRAANLHDGHVCQWRRDCKSAVFAHRYRTDAVFNAKQKLRARLRKMATADGELAAYLANTLKKGPMWKRWEAMLGYSTRQLVDHLRKTLPKRATWDDFLAGRLHIDHIMPRARFDLTSVDEVKRCWALSNLQLLWARDNIRKSDRVEVLL